MSIVIPPLPMPHIGVHWMMGDDIKGQTSCESPFSKKCYSCGEQTKNYRECGECGTPYCDSCFNLNDYCEKCGSEME